MADVENKQSIKGPNAKHGRELFNPLLHRHNHNGRRCQEKNPAEKMRSPWEERICHPSEEQRTNSEAKEY